MRIGHIVDSETKAKLNKLCIIQSKQKKQHEKLSDRELADLMGTNRDKYRRHRRAWRSR